MLLEIIDIDLGIIMSELLRDTEADVLVTGYYNPFPTTGFIGRTGDTIEPFIGALNSKIEAHARIDSRALSVDLASAFVGHEVSRECSYIEPLASPDILRILGAGVSCRTHPTTQTPHVPSDRATNGRTQAPSRSAPRRRGRAAGYPSIVYRTGTVLDSV